ncbi:MAG: GntR family transcriptional regulator [Anaerolineales bacterium]|nr:GntR family transcriptional regulator [Anaerolineales bacterium]
MAADQRINFSSHIPVYKQIAQWMREQIQNGVWEIDQQIMTEIEISQMLEVSRGTVRNAIEMLCEEGLLVRTRGKGTFVVATTMDQPLTTGFITISEDLTEKDIPYQTQVLRKEVIQSPDWVRDSLRLSVDDQVFYLERVRLVHNCPYYYLRNYVVYKHCPGIERYDFTQVKLFHVLEKQYQLILDWGRRHITAQNAGPQIARHLRIDEQDAVMCLDQHTFLRNHQPIEFSKVWIRGNSIRLVADLQRSSGGPMGGSKLDFNLPSSEQEACGPES